MGFDHIRVLSGLNIQMKQSYRRYHDEECVAIDGCFACWRAGWSHYARRVARQAFAAASRRNRKNGSPHARRMTLKGYLVWRAPDFRTEHTTSRTLAGTAVV
jgi:hypothetical protein